MSIERAEFQRMFSDGVDSVIGMCYNHANHFLQRSYDNDRHAFHVQSEYDCSYARLDYHVLVSVGLVLLYPKVNDCLINRH